MQRLRERTPSVSLCVRAVQSERLPLERAREIFHSVGLFTTTVAVTHTRSEEELRQISVIHLGAVQVVTPSRSCHSWGSAPRAQEPVAGLRVCTYFSASLTTPWPSLSKGVENAPAICFMMSPMVQ